MENSSVSDGRQPRQSCLRGAFPIIRIGQARSLLGEGAGG